MFTCRYVRAGVRAGWDLKIDLDHPDQAVGVPGSQTHLVHLSR
jgi:hypothetical protein